MTMEPREPQRLLEMTARIAAAYVAHNPVPVAELPRLLERIHTALLELDGEAGAIVRPELRPAVPIKKSVTDDHIICLEDGRKFKSLKRHLRTRYDMSPEEYRERWNLPPDYPMVAPNYARHRSDLARRMGLGQAKDGTRMTGRADGQSEP